MIIILEKKYKIIFLWEKITPKLVILQSREKLQVLKIFLKKSFQLICADKSYKMVSGIFFFLNGSCYIELSVVFRFWKIVFHHKIINKTLWKKISGKFSTSFWIQWSHKSSHFCNIGLNPKELELLKYVLVVITFFNENL